MNDTSKEMEEKYFELLMRRSGEERLKMGASMYDTAKEIVRSSILEESKNITPVELKKKIFLRFYGHEFTEVRRQKILKALE